MEAPGVKELYESYEKFIFRYLYGLTGSRDLAEELTQETFFQVVRSFQRFRGEASATTWLYKVARNTYGNWRRRKQPLDLSEYEESLEAESIPGPSEVVEARERIRAVREALARLPETYRELLLLREWQELGYEEIAVILGRSLSWVKVNIYRARIAFKRIYEKGEMGIE